jgi:Ser/Thr protein kinase RdoA (MazF antagonist)
VQPVPGELVGEGVSSTIHAWGEGRVVKLFRPGFEDLAAVELERARAVHEAGVPSPAVHELVEVDGRPGVVFDRLDGPSLLRSRDAGPLTAQVHVEVHGLSVPGLPQLADTLAGRGISGLDAGRAVFHGDLHPGNVLRHGSRWCVIDWSNAHLAPPAADVACTMLAIGYRALPASRADEEVHRRRMSVADRYLGAYRERRPGALHDLATWMAVIGRLLLEQEPDTAFADELRARWLEG